ncbi:MAG: oligosaccharide repeat unit polymerase, partial [Parachlamydia sp.]|nr:oligosaccharide repeat unit polymerase [Parachlamydia sp.]
MITVLLVYISISAIVGYFCIAKNNLINVYSVVVFTLCVVYILPYLSPDCPFKDDQYFSIIVILGLLGFFASFFLVSFLRKQHSLCTYWLSGQYPRMKCRSAVLSVLAMAGAILVWFNMVSEIQSLATEGIIAFLMRDRIREYQEIGLLNYGHFIIFLKRFLIIPVYLELFRLWKDRGRLAWFYFGTLLLEPIFFSHGRFGILMLIVLPFLYQHFYVRPIAIKKITILIFFLIVLIGSFNVIRGGGAQNLRPDVVSTSSTAGYLYTQLTRAGSGSTGTFYRMYELIQENDVDIEFGKQYLILLYTPIPRMFWPDKPIVSYFGRLTEILEGRLPGIGQKVLTSTILGEAYHQFGLVGVFFTPLIYVLMIYFYILFLGR